MTGGVNAGRLNIEIVAEIARLQQDLDKAKRAVKSMSNDIARDTRAANDNFSRMGRSFEQSGRRVTASSGQQQFAMRNLSFQLNDIATMYALGARPMQIFASQSGQVIQSVQMMSVGTGRLAAFLGGPWGLAITSAVIVLVPLVAKLFEAEEAAKKVEFATSKFGDAQSILGTVLDLTTGKIKDQTGAVLALARAQLVAGQIEARREQASARKKLADTDPFSLGLRSVGGPLGRGLPLPVRVPDNSAGIAASVLEGAMNTAEAERSLRSLLRTGVITEQQYLDTAQAVTQLGVAVENLKTFEQAEAVLGGDAGALGRFLNPTKPRRSRQPGLSDAEKDLRSRDQETRRFIESLDEEIAKLGLDEKALRQLEIARALEVAVTAKQRGEIGMLNARREESIAVLERETRLKEARRDTENLTETVEALRREAQVLELVGWARERGLLRLEREAEIKPLLVKQTEALARGEEALAAELQKQIDLLNERYGIQIQMGDRLNRVKSPFELWAETVPRDAEAMITALQDIQVRGFDSLASGIADVLTGTKSLSDAFGDMARGIIADIIQMTVRMLIFRALSSAFPSMFGSVPTTGGYGGGLPFGGFRASGGPVQAGVPYVVGERGEEWFVPKTNGTIYPNGAHPMAANNNGQIEVLVTVDTSPELEARVDAKVVGGMQQAVKVSVDHMNGTLRKFARPKLSGR